MPKTTPILLARCRATQPVEKAITAIEALLKAQPNTELQLHIVLPFSFLEPVNEHFRGDHLVLGTEIVLDTQADSFPAPIAAQMALEANASFALIGSAMERSVYNPTAEALQSKLLHCLEKNLTPVVCIADTWEQNSDGESKRILKEQLVTFLEVLSKEQRRKTYILYDAAWINDANWEGNYPLLQQAYRNYREVLEETMGDPLPNPDKVIYPIPSYGPDLSKVMTWLPAYGYFLGALDPLNSYTYPSIEYVALPEILPAPQEIEQTELTHTEKEETHESTLVANDETLEESASSSLVVEDQPPAPATEESYTTYAVDQIEEHTPVESISLPEDKASEPALAVEDQPPQDNEEKPAYANYAEIGVTPVEQVESDIPLSDDHKNYLNHLKDSPLVVENHSSIEPHSQASEPEFDIDLEDKPQK